MFVESRCDAHHSGHCHAPVDYVYEAFYLIPHHPHHLHPLAYRPRDDGTSIDLGRPILHYHNSWKRRVGFQDSHGCYPNPYGPGRTSRRGTAPNNYVPDYAVPGNAIPGNPDPNYSKAKDRTDSTARRPPWFDDTHRLRQYHGGYFDHDSGCYLHRLDCDADANSYEHGSGYLCFGDGGLIPLSYTCGEYDGVGRYGGCVEVALVYVRRLASLSAQFLISVLVTVSSFQLLNPLS